MALSTTARARLQASLALLGMLALWWRIGGIGPAMAAGATGSLALMAWVSPPHFAPIQRKLDLVMHAPVTVVHWLRSRLWLSASPLRHEDASLTRPDPAAHTDLSATRSGDSGPTNRQR